MELGTVKSFKKNERGGFGWLERKGHEPIYFTRGDGRRVEWVEGRKALKRPVGSLITEPVIGDVILFEIGSNQAGMKASPWCYKAEWDTAQLVQAAPDDVQPCITCEAGVTYRFLSRKMRGDKITGENEIWKGNGTTINLLLKLYPSGIPAQEKVGLFTHAYVFQRKSPNGWQPLGSEDTALPTSEEKPQLVEV